MLACRVMNRRRVRILRNVLKRPGALLNLFKLRVFLPFIQRGIELSVTPAVLDIEPTAKCNLQCKYCQVSYWERSDQVANLTYDQFVQIVGQFPYLVQIKLQGMGEPFLNADFFRMVDYAHEKGIAVRTVSNATLFTEGISEKIVKSPLAELTISVDAATKETFERLRRGARFDKVKENISRVVRARKEHGNGKEPILTVWMVGTKENVHEVPGVVRLAKDLQVDRVILQHHLNFWGAERYREKMEQYSINREETESGYSAEVKRILEEAKRTAKELKMPLEIYTGNTLFPRQKCEWPWSSVYISADGYVVPCCIVANPEVMEMGNVFRQKFHDIWNGEKYRTLRKAFMEGRPPGMCNGCYVGCEKSPGKS